jgi:TonB family protein
MGAFRRLSPSVTFSVLLHAALFLFWAFTVAHTHVTDRASQPKFILVEVDPLPKKNAADTMKNQVVQTEAAKQIKEAVKDAFLGEHTQVVDKQTVSMPKTGTAPKVSQAAPPKEKPAEKAPVITATGALAKFGIAISAGKEESPKPKAHNPIEEGSLTAQARGEYVKGFKEGEQTMLNTREFVFYGYFQRIRERLDHAWEKSLRDHLQKYFYRGRQLASETDYMTQLLVSLDKDGRITKVQIIGNSGTTELDEAATKAFNDAGPFPNPPTGLVDNRGQVLVRWDFVLKT